MVTNIGITLGINAPFIMRDCGRDGSGILYLAVFARWRLNGQREFPAQKTIERTSTPNRNEL